MQKSSPARSFKVILVMGLLTAIGPLSIDMYLPAFSAIAKSLNTTVADVTLSLSSLLVFPQGNYYMVRCSNVLEEKSLHTLVLVYTWWLQWVVHWPLR